MRPDGPRDLVAGPDSGPAPPFPLRLDGKVIQGFGRGSSEVSYDLSSFGATLLRGWHGTKVAIWRSCVISAKQGRLQVWITLLSLHSRVTISPRLRG